MRLFSFQFCAFTSTHDPYPNPLSALSLKIQSFMAMAVAAVFRLIFFSLFCFLPCVFSQPQNIETFYPDELLDLDPFPRPPSTGPVLPPPSQVAARSGSSTRAVAKAVGATAASTLVVAALLFFFIQRFLIARRQREKVVSTNESVAAGRPQASAAQGTFKKVNGNLKGLILDENGLDVLYWRRLEEVNKNDDLGKRVLMGSDGEEDDIEEVNRPAKVQEVPLLRGKSSNSHTGEIRPEKKDLRQEQAAGQKKAPVLRPSLPPQARPVRPSEALPQPPPPRGQDKKGVMPPLPPPAPLRKQAGAPPPPPPPKVGGAAATSTLKTPRASKAEDGDGAESSGNGQVKLKPLHWDKLNKNGDQTMVWDHINGGSFRFDGDLMEALFGYVATDKKSPIGSTNKGQPRSPVNSPPQQIILLEARKSQNIAIVLKSLAVSRTELLDALNEGRGLDGDVLEKLARIAPSPEEQSQILAFEGDPTRLADAESFLFHLLKAVPTAFTRISAMQFRSNYGSEVTLHKEALKTLEMACHELRTRGIFVKLLEAILKAGNRMNAGTARGNAKAFKLTSLRKLSDVKSSDGKTTLLHFVVQEVVRSEGKRCVINRNPSLSSSQSSSSFTSVASNGSTSKEEREKEYMMLGLPIIGGLSSEFSNVKKAASLDYNMVAATCSGLSDRTAEIRQLVSRCAASDGRGGFKREMNVFLDAAEEELMVVRGGQKRVLDLVKRTTDYYQAGDSNDKEAQPLQLFVIVKEFLNMVDQACVEIARNLQRKPSSSTSSSTSSSPSPANRGMRPLNLPVSRTRPRFPNLPAHFMGGRSNSSSSSGSDTES